MYILLLLGGLFFICPLDLVDLLCCSTLKSPYLFSVLLFYTLLKVGYWCLQLILQNHLFLPSVPSSSILMVCYYVYKCLSLFYLPIQLKLLLLYNIIGSLTSFLSGIVKLLKFKITLSESHKAKSSLLLTICTNIFFHSSTLNIFVSLYLKCVLFISSDYAFLSILPNLLFTWGV